MNYSKITLITASGINESLFNMVSDDVMVIYDTVEDSDSGAELKDRLMELSETHQIYRQPKALRITGKYCRVQLEDGCGNISYLKIDF